MQKSLAKLSIFCENAKGFDLFLFVFADISRETEENICYYSTTSQSFNPLPCT